MRRADDRARAATPRRARTHRRQRARRARAPSPDRSSSGACSSRPASTCSGGYEAGFAKASAGSSRRSRLRRTRRPSSAPRRALPRPSSSPTTPTTGSPAARSIDVGIDLLASASEPPPILGMLMCLRGECDVFNGDAKSGRGSHRGRARDRAPSAGRARRVGRELLPVERGQREARATVTWTPPSRCSPSAPRRLAAAVSSSGRWSPATRGRDLGGARGSRRIPPFWERALRCRQEIGAVNVGHRARLDADSTCSRSRAWPRSRETSRRRRSSYERRCRSRRRSATTRRLGKSPSSSSRRRRSNPRRARRSGRRVASGTSPSTARASTCRT